MRTPINCGVNTRAPRRVTVDILTRVLRIGGGTPNKLVVGPSRPSKRRLIIVHNTKSVTDNITLHLCRTNFGIVVLRIRGPAIVHYAITFTRTIFSNRVAIRNIATHLTADSTRTVGLARHKFVPIVMSPTYSLLSRLGPLYIISTVLTGRGLKAQTSVTPMAVTLKPNFATKGSYRTMVRAGHKR